jgi:DNA-binding transcriptional LysR family regulator
LSKGPLDWVQLAQLDWIFPPPNTPMRRTFNSIFVGAGVHPPSPILETLSLKSIANVLRAEPNGITILARDMAPELSAHGGCAALSHRLSWNLPPVSFFVTRQMADRPTVRLLAQTIREVAQGLGGHGTAARAGDRDARGSR